MSNIIRRASALLFSLAVLSGAAASPALAATSGTGAGFVAAPDAAVIPYGSTGPVVLDLLANDSVPDGLDILPGNNADGVFGYNRSVCAAADSGSICEIKAVSLPASVQALTLPGDFVGIIPIVQAGADYYAIHQKNRLLLVVLPYEGASGTVNFNSAWAAAGPDGVPGMVMTSTASVSIGSPEVSAADDYVKGAGSDGSIAYMRADGTLAIAEGKTLSMDINPNDYAVLSGRKTTHTISANNKVETPEGIVGLNGTTATFYSYSPSFTGKTTPVPYEVCSSYTIIPTAPQDAGQKQNLRTDTVCATAYIVFEIPERPTFLAPPLEVWAPVQPPVVVPPVVEPPVVVPPVVEPPVVVPPVVEPPVVVPPVVEPPVVIPAPKPTPTETPTVPAVVEEPQPTASAVPQKLAETGAKGTVLMYVGFGGLILLVLGGSALVVNRKH